ncbi:MAG: methyl-accepting chemotaxis protein, partial [Defluviitaleaceae bacterium]|nr:methyl-accepting chemotaxis protein [Defluviitaleaceae bacterium]
MGFLRNMKIKFKLGVGFGLLLVIMVLIAVFAINSIRNLGDEVAYARDWPTERYNKINYMATDIMDMRRVVAMMALYTGNAPMVNFYEAEARLARLAIRDTFADYFYSLENDPNIEETRRVALLAEANRLNDLVREYIDQVVVGVYISGLWYDMEGMLYYINLGDEKHAEIEQTFNRMRDAAQYTQQIVADGIENSALMAIILMAGLVLLGVILGVLIAWLISNMIAKPVNNVVDALGAVASGQLNVNIDKSKAAKDEIGTLLHYTCDLVSVIRNVADDVVRANHEFNKVGDTGYRIDDTKYENSFKDVMN